jgi:hypothetical protein
MFGQSGFLRDSATALDLSSCRHFALERQPPCHANELRRPKDLSSSPNSTWRPKPRSDQCTCRHFALESTGSSCPLLSADHVTLMRRAAAFAVATNAPNSTWRPAQLPSPSPPMRPTQPSGGRQAIDPKSLTSLSDNPAACSKSRHSRSKLPT